MESKEVVDNELLKIKEINVAAGDQTSRLNILAQLMSGLSGLFEVVRDPDADAARKMFGTDQVSKAKRAFKIKVVVEIEPEE